MIDLNLINLSPRIENPLLSISLLMQAAASEVDGEKKRSTYNKAFAILRQQGLEGKLRRADAPILFSLLEAYATSICYHQKTNEVPQEGFKKCAVLMEFSLGAQLIYLGLFPDEQFPWERFESLDALTKSLKIEEEESKFFSHFFSLLYIHKLNRDCLHEAAHKHGITDIVKNSLIRLAYSYQNIACLTSLPSLRLGEFTELYSRVKELVEKFLENDPKKMAEFAYNSFFFMASIKRNFNLDPLDLWAQHEAYQQSLPFLEKALSSSEYKRKQEQVEKIHKLLNKDAIDHSDAQDYLSLGFQFHLELIKDIGFEEVPTQKFLLGNFLSVIIGRLCSRNRSEEAKVHANTLKILLEDLDRLNDHRRYRKIFEEMIKEPEKPYNPRHYSLFI